MPFYLRYNQQTNHLVDISPTELYPIDGTVVEFREGDLPDLNTLAWNPSTLDFYICTENRVVTKLEFLTRFTVPERANIRVSAKQDPFVEDFLEMLKIAEYINLDDRNTTAAMAYLQYVGLLSESRVTEILS